MKDVQREIEDKLVTRPAVPIPDDPNDPKMVVAEAAIDIDRERRDFLTLRHDKDLIWADIDYESSKSELRGNLLPRRSIERLLQGLKKFGNGD